MVTTAAPQHLLLFDGVCVFCNGAVRWLMARDPQAQMRFAPLQGETAAALRARHPEIPQALETLVYVESDAAGERVYLRSAGLFRVLARLDSPWRHAAKLRWLPRRLCDALYLAFARRRYRLFGEALACPLPTPQESQRFLP
ncbi:MAG TPA: DCC1-like thiol-disulfide oxidoreductase family protein [Myxococcota bacterium]|nr:DCC1-like thiol-disulfide oxidoreductase family protein [Myxococcota bacterium]